MFTMKKVVLLPVLVAILPVPVFEVDNEDDDEICLVGRMMINTIDKTNAARMIV